MLTRIVCLVAAGVFTIARSGSIDRWFNAGCRWSSRWRSAWSRCSSPAIGVYGRLACQVTERRREIGIRMALGSSAADVFRLVMRDGAHITALGSLVGLAGALGMARLMAGLLYGVRAGDPTVVGAVTALLVRVALVAT